MLADVFASEYEDLKRRWAASNGDIMTSRNPRVRAVGSMIYDGDGVCRIELTEPEAFDFNGFMKHLKDNSVAPTPNLVHKVLGLADDFEKTWKNSPGWGK
jgi:hypothetical protein